MAEHATCDGRDLLQLKGFAFPLTKPVQVLPISFNELSQTDVVGVDVLGECVSFRHGVHIAHTQRRTQ